MTTAPARTDASVTSPPPAGGWQWLLRGTALCTLLLLVAATVALRDLEAAAISAGFAVGCGLLLFRRGLAGQLLLAVMFANVAFWMVLGAATNIAGGEGFVPLVLPAALAASSLTGLVAAIAALATRKAPSAASRGPLVVAVGGAQVLIALLVAGALTGGWAGGPSEDVDLALVAEQAAFSSTALTADAGRISVSLANRDLFWHTFTIDELDVDVNVPVNAERSTTFDAPAGTYTFVCRIPGHESAGMVGTLEVR